MVGGFQQCLRHSLVAALSRRVAGTCCTDVGNVEEKWRALGGTPCYP